MGLKRNARPKVTGKRKKNVSVQKDLKDHLRKCGMLNKRKDQAISFLGTNRLPRESLEKKKEKKDLNYLKTTRVNTSVTCTLFFSPSS